MFRYYPIRSYVDEVGAEYPNVNGDYMNVFELDRSIGNNLSPWLNYNIGGGCSMFLRNNNYLQCNFVANFSDKKIIDGTYKINVTGKPQSTGTYSAKWSYVGLSFSYILTGANKRLRKCTRKIKNAQMIFKHMLIRNQERTKTVTCLF